MEQKNEDILYFELRNNKDEVIARLGNLSDFPAKFSVLAQENFSEGEMRNVFRVSTLGSIHIIVNKNHELFQGNKSIQRACEIYLTFIPKLRLIQLGQKQSFDAVIRRFAHNLIKFQKRFKDNFNRLMPDKYRGRPYSEFKEEVKKMIEYDTSRAADDVCQLSHRALDLDAQIETLRIIAGYADNTGTLLPTNIQKALCRLTNPFVGELRKRNINIEIDIDNELANKNKIKVIHSLFNAAIWQLFDNISKYAMDDTDIKITAELESVPKCLIFSMVSVTIEDDEKETIFLENQQGRNIKKSDKVEIFKEGNGIGLYIVKKALVLMGAKIKVTNNGFIMNKNGYPYSKHTFAIEFLS